MHFSSSTNTFSLRCPFQFLMKVSLTIPVKCAFFKLAEEDDIKKKKGRAGRQLVIYGLKKGKIPVKSPQKCSSASAKLFAGKLVLGHFGYGCQNGI